MNCKEAVAALIASLETGTPMSDDARAHVSGCDRCAVLLSSAREFQTSLEEEIASEPAIGPATVRAEEEVVRTSRQRIVLRVAAVAFVGAVLLVLASIAGDTATRTEQATVFFTGVAVAVVVAIPVLLIFGVARAIVRPASGRPLYKRLGPGRMLSGVALGIAEAAKLNVNIVRLLFFGLLFFDGVGLILYILLALFMPVHPADRQYMLRFRVRRWFGSTAGSTQ